MVNGNQLSGCLYQRRGGNGLGVMFNIAYYAMLTRIIASHCGLKAIEFVYFLSNVHIYDDHFDSLHVQIEREPFPKLIIKEPIENINNISIDNFEIENYEFYPKLEMTMRK